MQHYADNDLKLRRFVPIIQRSLVYPVILDARRTVLSLPPIINGAHSAVRSRQNFFIGAPQTLCRVNFMPPATQECCSLAVLHCGQPVAKV